MVLHRRLSRRISRISSRSIAKGFITRVGNVKVKRSNTVCRCRDVTTGKRVSPTITLKEKIKISREERQRKSDQRSIDKKQEKTAKKQERKKRFREALETRGII